MLRHSGSLWVSRYRLQLGEGKQPPPSPQHQKGQVGLHREAASSQRRQAARLTPQSGSLGLHRHSEPCQLTLGKDKKPCPVPSATPGA